MAKKVMVRVAPSTGDPNKGIVPEDIIVNRDRNVRNLDVRDRLSELVGKGNMLNPDDKAAIYSSLTASLGKDKATKIMQHAYIFNQRPDMLRLPLEDKLKAFYTLGSNDQDVNDVIARSKSLGYGVLPGFRNSSSYANQVLAGRLPDSLPISANEEVKNRILMQTKKNQ